MKEIYIINEGENIKNMQKELGEDIKLPTFTDNEFDINYCVIKEGVDNIIKVKNYNPAFLYTVKRGETLMDIMSRGLCLGNIDSVEEGDILVLRRNGKFKHVVKPLENIDKIAEMYNTTKEEIMEANRLQVERLFLGQILWV